MSNAEKPHQATTANDIAQMTTRDLMQELKRRSDACIVLCKNADVAGGVIAGDRNHIADLVAAVVRGIADERVSPEQVLADLAPRVARFDDAHIGFTQTEARQTAN